MSERDDVSSDQVEPFVAETDVAASDEYMDGVEDLPVPDRDPIEPARPSSLLAVLDALETLEDRVARVTRPLALGPPKALAAGDGWGRSELECAVR
jgi:hypothetical protein